MAGGQRRFTLHDGETLVLSEGDLEQVYELLWELAPRPGAISVAAVIRGKARADRLYGPPIDLDAPQSAAMREAVARLRA